MNTLNLIKRKNIRFYNNGKELAKKGKDTLIEKIQNLPPADIISGVPEELKLRTVRIFQPSKTAMQSGLEQTRFWKMDFDITENSSRWENPLIGWASTADCVQALQIKFKNKDQAILFAEKQGWNYYIQEPKLPKFRKKLYADNFVFQPNKLKFIHTK